MSELEMLDRGREAFARREWASAYMQLAAAADDPRIGPADLDILAHSALLLGRDDEAGALFARAHQGFLAAGDPDRAVRSAFWAAMSMLGRGHDAQGAGWLTRAQRLVDQGVAGEVAGGYLGIGTCRRDLLAGQALPVVEGAGAVLAVAERAGDPDLGALARLLLGTAQVMLGERNAGLALLDEAMVAVTSGEVSGMPAGIVYCGVIDVCTAALDLGRAREWTEALNRWCDAQPDLVPFRGECLVHRSRLMLRRGAWQDCLDEAERALERLTGQAERPNAGAAWYQRAEVLRLQGEFAAATGAYRAAAECGVDPQPGLALLRLAQGAGDDAAASIRRACAEAGTPYSRSTTLAAAVEILLAVGDRAGARAAVEDLAGTEGGPVLGALAGQARGALLLAEAQPERALTVLRSAWATWERLDEPYEVARTRVLLARACLALGDEDGARLELEAACRAYRRLGAHPDLAKAEHDLASASPASSAPGGLTPREVEVLRLVASGRTNRAIAGELFLSEKTVARHVSNMFTKLDLTSRSAMTAYAYEHHLV